MARGLFLFSVAAVSLLMAAGVQAQGPAPSSAALVLESVFNPQRAPAHKTMGLLQRSFLDLVETSHQELQVALVVDGTESMGRDLEGVRTALRSLIADLRQYKGDHVSLALVVYRDTGSPSGPVTLLQSQFTKDDQVLAAGLEKLQPESGAPFFLELPDLGVHEALSKLNWTEGPETSRWLLLFGDAPPYDPDFVDKEENTDARRRFDTDVLVNLAKRKEVQISCVLCTSREEDREVYEQVVDKTRKFMNDLASGSGGLMLDLSYPDIRAALVEAAKKTRVERQRIGVITREEVDALRQAAAAAKAPVADGQRLRVAVLPHLPLNQMTFDPTHDAVQIATELRLKLKSLPRAEVASPVDVERALRRVRAGSLSTEQQLQAISLQLRADYLVWGTYRKAQGVVSVRSAVYRKSDGQKVTESQLLTGDTLPETELAGNLITKWTLTTFEPSTAPELHAALAQLRSETPARTQVLTPVARTVQTRTELLTGFEALERALAFALGEGEANQKLLDQAEQSLRAAATQDARNPFIQMLLASCYFNQSRAAAAAGNTELSQAKARQYSEAIKRAYVARDQSPVDLVRLEIEADYQLVANRDAAAAIKVYETLARAPHDASLHTALRAHWMLAGIYSGDWGVPEAVIDVKKAREHLLVILAYWPDTPEAAFIKANLRWSDERGGNQFPSFPLTNDVVLSQL